MALEREILFVLVFTTFLTLFLLLANLFGKDKKLIQTRLAKFVVKDHKRELLNAELDKPFLERVIYPILKFVSGFFSRFMPERRINILIQELLFAGNPGNLTPSEFLGIQYTLAFGLPSLLAVVLISLGFEGAKLLISVGAFGITGFYLPRLYLKHRSRQRKDEIEKTLPDALDLLTVSVEAGLGFDSALAKVSAKTKGSLAQEFIRVLQEIKMGKPRRDALRDLTLRCQSDDLANFISSIIQADQLGVSIGNVLRLQSEQMRLAKRQRSEEKAMKAPVKMLIPLVLFIFPTLFIVLLGPALIQIFQTLGK